MKRVMESPVRILIGAAVTVHLLLLTSTAVNGSALPNDTFPTTVKDEKVSNFGHLNGTRTINDRVKTLDIALNELHPKDSTSEEHTENNIKYKDRGRVRFHSQLKSSTESPLRRIRLSPVTSNIVEVTPASDVKKLFKTMDSTQKDKPTIARILASSTSTVTSMPLSAEKESDKIDSDEEEDENDDEYDHYRSNKDHESDFFTIPGYNDDEKKYNRIKEELNTPSFDKYSSFFSKDTYSPQESKNDGPYKLHNFFDFDSDLTTPKNDFFDQKYHDISSSIMKNLASIKTKSPPANATNTQKIIKENVGFEKLSNGSPNNKSTVIIKNTKETRLLDNEQAGSVNSELSDVHGTSIYYEMSVLSTETYHFSDDDCENETPPIKTTVSTSLSEEEAYLKATQPTTNQISPLPMVYSTDTPFMSQSVIPNSINTIIPIAESGIPISTQNSLRSPDRPVKVVSSGSYRNRDYSKRLNFAGNKDSINSVTQQSDPAISLAQRPLTRKFHYTTPKTKPIWMATRRNITKAKTYPTTIYAEHFNIKDKFTSTFRPMLSQKAVLTTFASDIDPVLQSDVSGVKKVVQSQVISDNMIPTLWKRGSMKFTTTSAAPTVVETGISDLEIPPTMTAWALASLRSPPSSSSAVGNVSVSTQKSVDENELQKVSEVVDNKETITAPTTTISINSGALSNDVSNNVTEMDQNKLPWKPITSINDISDEKEIVTRSERLPAESNISIQSSLKPSNITQVPQKISKIATETIESNELKPLWIPAMINPDVTTTEETVVSEKDNIQPVDATKSTGFESITKLPSGVTTPTDENDSTVTQQSEIETTPNLEITTIRLSYVPPEDATEETEASSTSENWRSAIPTRTMPTTFDDSPITTYRPKYTTTSVIGEETTAIFIDTTPQLEISSQIIEDATHGSSGTSTKPTTEAFNRNQPATTDLPSTTVTDCEETTYETTSTTTIQTELITEKIREIMDIKETTENPEAFKTTDESTLHLQTDSRSEENSDSNEVILQDTTETPTTTPSSIPSTSTITEDFAPNTSAFPLTTTTLQTTTNGAKENDAQPKLNVVTTQQSDETTAYTTEMTTKSISELEDLTSYAEDVTTESSSRVLTEEAGSGAAIAIAVSTIGVIALVLLLGLLLVVRRRGRRGVYAQRCTPVSLDAYSLDSVSVGHRKGNHRLRASKRSYGNPAYDDEVTSHPMQFPALASFALDVASVSAEFAQIPSAPAAPEHVPPGCEDKNRYSNVLPLPQTRVRLARLGNDPTTEYINANYVTGPGNIRNYYILCQAPMANTVVDFWRMIWEQNSRVIVMLTEYMENGVEKCYEYLPPSEVSDNKRTFGDYQIILKKREQRDKYAISSVQLINLSTRSWREITHLWYFWPANGVPEDYDSVIDFLSEMRSYMKISQTAKEYDEEGVEVIYGEQSGSSLNKLSKLRGEERGAGNGANAYSPARAERTMRSGQEEAAVRPCTCVCASGAGRSAALVALEGCARALAAGAADVPRAVRELRAQRPHALANRHHYLFLYKVLSEYGSRLTGAGADAV